MAVGYIPVINAARLGALTPTVVNIRVYRMPSVANLSKLGVTATLSP